MSDIPPPAQKSSAQHKEALDRALLQLESAATAQPPVKPETFATIADSVRGVTRLLLEDAERLEELVNFWEHRAR